MSGHRRPRAGIGGPTTTLLAAALLLPVGAPAQQASPDAPRFFRLSDQCVACHADLTAPSGEDVSISFDWRSSMMANSARDPYWQAAVRREVLDHPGAEAAIQHECSTCHMPMAHFRTAAEGGDGTVFGHLPVGAAAGRSGLLAADGVSCSMCHQISAEKLGTEESFVGGFVVDTTTLWGSRSVFGPFQVDAGRTHLMQSSAAFAPAQGTHVQSSELCATCHTLYTHALDENDEVVGELPEQVPYLEWLHSDYAEGRSCQSCHMPVVADSVSLSDVHGQPRAGFSRHVFRGGNFFIVRMMNRYRGELGVVAKPQELDATAGRTIENLRTGSARLSVDRVSAGEGGLTAELAVSNLAGHKLPTAYPSRRVWLHVTVRDADGGAVFESGAFTERGAIVGNDNDADPGRFEPHHAEIREPGQVQVYEAIMGDQEGRPTTGVTTGVTYIKDSRLLPRGFDKATAPEDVAVRGQAAGDADFSGGGDRVRYVVDVGDAEGPFTVEAELWYQPISFRWARNLARHEAPEIDRFLRYWDSMAAHSAVILAEARATSR